MVRENGIQITHLDTHHQIHDMWAIMQIMLELLKTYNIPSIRILNNLEKSDYFYKNTYRNIINYYLKVRNYNFTNFLGNQIDFLSAVERNPTFLNIKNKRIEIMVHPDFNDNGLLIDKIGGNEYDFNFSDAPNLPYYHFQNDVKIPDSEGLFVEIPLSTYQNNPLYRLTNKLQLIVNRDKVFGDGKGIQEKSFFFIRSLTRRLNFSKAFLTFDKTSNCFFKYLMKYYFNRAQFLVIISHPKTLSKQGLLNLSYVTKEYNTVNSSDLHNLFIA